MTSIESLNPDIPLFARTGINLASAGLGARAIWASNQFFAPLDRMLQDHDPVFIEGKFDDHGKWMDGWETQRRRDGGHDSAIIRLAGAGRIIGFDIDTTHFTGNYAPAARIEACSFAGDEPPADQTWVEILRHKPLGPSAHHYHSCQNFERLVASAHQYLSRRRHRSAQGLRRAGTRQGQCGRARSTSPRR